MQNGDYERIPSYLDQIDERLTILIEIVRGYGEIKLNTEVEEFANKVYNVVHVRPCFFLNSHYFFLLNVLFVRLSWRP